MHITFATPTMKSCAASVITKYAVVQSTRKYVTDYVKSISVI